MNLNRHHTCRTPHTSHVTARGHAQCPGPGPELVLFKRPDCTDAALKASLLIRLGYIDTRTTGTMRRSCRSL